MAINFRRPGRTWVQSSLGESLSCLLVAEVLHHPASVARSEADGPNGKQMPGVTLDHRLPRSYILVKNNLHVRARYLILWRQSTAARSAKWWMLLVLYVLTVHVCSAADPYAVTHLCFCSSPFPRIIPVGCARRWFKSIVLSNRRCARL